jgi:hypothetical protein
VSSSSSNSLSTTTTAAATWRVDYDDDADVYGAEFGFPEPSNEADAPPQHAAEIYLQDKTPYKSNKNNKNNTNITNIDNSVNV